MKNLSSPIQSKKRLITDVINKGNSKRKTIQLAPNEFISSEDYFGIFSKDPETIEYLSIEKESNDVRNSEYANLSI